MLSYAYIMYEALYHGLWYFNTQYNICPQKDILYTRRTEKLLYTNTGEK